MRPIAEDAVVWVLPSGEQRPGRIAIGAPEPAPYFEGDDTWKCEVLLDGLWHRPLEARGEGSLQPLMLVLKQAGAELHAFVSRGGRVVMPGERGPGDELHPVLISFRELLRQPADPLPADPVLAELDAER